MKIIIAGAGNVGTHLAKLLSREKQDIILMDDDEEKLTALSSNFDLLTVTASPSSISGLKEVGVKEADLFIAVTPDESRNMTACMLATNLGAKKTVARIDNYEYLLPKNKEFFRKLGVDSLIYPEMLAAKEIVSSMRMSWVRQWWEFCGGALILIGTKMREKAEILNIPLHQLGAPDIPYHVVAIKRNKLRTFLTGFAVAWGIFMLIVLLGAGNGLIHAFEQSASERAMNSIKIFPGWTSKSYDGLKEGRRVQLDNKDMDATSHYFPNHVIKAGATVWQGAVNLSFGQEYVSLNLSGVYPNHTEVEVVKLFEGRFINEIDIKERRKVIVLHKKTAEILFNKTHTEPIGQFVNAGNVVYQVVGLYNDKGDSGDSDAYIPFTTLQTIYNKGDKLNNLVMTTKNLETVEANEAFEAHYRKVLGANHRFDPTDHSAIWIWNRFTNYLQQQKGSGMLRIAIWVIGIFTLLSGIVGVSNIMLITVKERTREFGIRKALGAKPLSILWLIIVESVTITTIFGYIGMVAGIGVTEWMNSAFGNQTMDTGMWTETVFLNPTVDIRIAIQATLTLIIAGTLAGLFPARKAVSIRPIEALRAD